MIEVSPVSVSIVMLALSLISMYVKLTNTQTDHNARIVEIEKKVNNIFSKLEDHETQISEVLMEIKDSVHRVELSIEKIKKG